MGIFGAISTNSFLADFACTFACGSCNCFHHQYLVCSRCACSLICSLFGGQVWLQICLFFLVSILSLILTKPLVKKFVNPAVVSTNFDRIIGMDAVVTEEIDNLKAQGAVLVDGKVWTARSLDNSVIAKDSIVKACEIDGVKLIVSKINNK